MADHRETLDRAGEIGRLDRPSCLVLHGLGGGPYELEPLIAALRAEGLRVLSPVLPGHEGPGPVMPASRWSDWYATAQAGFDELTSVGGLVSVVGFSTGSTLALRLATRRPVARQVLLAPFLAFRYSGLIPLRPASYLLYLASVVPDLPRRPPAVRDREMRRWASNASRFRTFSLAATQSALELIAVVEREVPEIRVPTLIIQGRRDTVVEPANASWLYRNLGSTEKRLLLMHRSDHLLALDRERDLVIAETLAFLLGRLEPPASATGES
jgi:carboxylesterase